MQGVLGEPSPDWGAQAESVGEGPGKGGEDAVPPAEEAAGSARPGRSPCPSLPGDTPPILRARCSYSQRRYVQVERFCLVKTEVGLCVVAVLSHPRELLSGLMATPAEGGSTGRGPAPPFPPPLTAARAGMWRGRRESHGPLTPHGQSAALGCSHRPSLLAWRFPVWKKCRWLLSPRPIPPRLRSASAVTCRRSLVTGGWRNPQRLC